MSTGPAPSKPSLLERFRQASVTLPLPSLAAVILGLIGGIAQVLNYSVIPASSQLHAGIAVGLYFLIAAGIPPLTGDSFKAALHLPAWASMVVNALLGAGVLALGSIHMTAALHEILAAVITVLSALGFNASVLPVAAELPRP